LLIVKKLHAKATIPTIAYEMDLCWDVYANEEKFLYKGQIVSLSTGIACAAFKDQYLLQGEASGLVTPLGLIVKDRSSLAVRGVTTHGGVIDPGYRGEIIVLMMNTNSVPWLIRAGDKIAQLLPVEILTGPVYEQADLPPSERGIKGFGSSGR
jgi:dUTP pyrophosphatase